MTNAPFPQRKSPRLQGYDYSRAGAYFVTICTHQRQHLFGSIADGELRLTPSGEIAVKRWYALPDHHAGVELDAFVVMPNHVHGIVVLSGVSDHTKIVPTLGTVIGSYKSGVTRRIREIMGIDDLVVWQGRYHDHIIRDERGLNTIRHYVLNNINSWVSDTYHSDP